MEKFLVSIIIPVYNVEKYLKTCLESVIHQTYNNIEIIVVNDGSTDKSLEICKFYAGNDNRIILIDKKNEGLSSARQAGIDKAQGYYFCTVDSDDYIEREFVEKMYAQISKEKSDMCVCATREYSASTSRIRGFNQCDNYSIQVTAEDIERNYNTLINTYYMHDSWNKIYRTEFVRNSEVRFSLSKEFNGTDLLFNHLLLLHLPQISVLREPLYNYQILENSRVRRKNKQLQKGFMIIMNEIIIEIERLNYSNKINKQLTTLYVMLLREASQDIFNSGLNSKDLYEKFEEFYTMNKQYLQDNKRIKLKSKYMETLSLKIFCYLLKSLRLFWYLRLRQKLLNLIA